MAYKPLGARILVEELVTTLSLEERGAKVGIQVITDERNRPKPTSGKVVAIGTDPLLRDAGLKEGCVVQFARLAGTHVFIDGEQYRSLEFQEIIGFENPKENTSENDSDINNAVSSADRGFPKHPIASTPTN